MRSAEPYEPAAHYDRVSAAWRLLLGPELHYGLFVHGDEDLGDATGAMTTAMIAAARLEPGMTLLDVGCGTGTPALRLARNYGVDVLGISTSRVGVGIAQLAAEAERASAYFEVRDGTDTQLPDASFDRVWLLESSHLIRDRAKLVNECARLLRPGGRLVLCDIIRRREIAFDEVRRLRVEFATLRRAFGDAHMESLSRYAELAIANGLDVDQSLDLTVQTLGTFDRWRRNATAHRDEVVGLLGTDGYDAFVGSLDILERFWQDGTFGYGLLTADKAQ